MKKLAKFFAYSLFFVLALILFTPKDSIYYLLEKSIKEFGVVISKETLNEHLFWLEVNDLEVSAKAIDAASVKSLDITLLGLYNSVESSEIKLSSLVEAYLPSKIEHLQISYSIFSPFNVEAEAKGEFGEMQAAFNLLDSNATATLQPSKLMLKKYRKSLKFFKKSDNGEYVYAKNIKY